MINLGSSLLKMAEIGSADLGAGKVVLSANLWERAGAIGEELISFLEQKNGAYLFESSLHIFPAQTSPLSVGIDEWNSDEGWRQEYGDLAAGYLFFAEDLFGVQFCIKSDSVWSFDPETGDAQFIGKSLDDWAGEVLRDFRVLTGHPLAQAWQRKNGPLPVGYRLVPKVPFVCGGAFDLSNLILMDADRGMRLRGQLASQIKDLPDGAKIRFVIE